MLAQVFGEREAGQQPEGADDQPGGDVACEMHGQDHAAGGDGGDEHAGPEGELEAQAGLGDFAQDRVGDEAVDSHGAGGMAAGKRGCGGMGEGEKLGPGPVDDVLAHVGDQLRAGHGEPEAGQERRTPVGPEESAGHAGHGHQRHDVGQMGDLGEHGHYVRVAHDGQRLVDLAVQAHDAAALDDFLGQIGADRSQITGQQHDQGQGQAGKPIGGESMLQPGREAWKASPCQIDELPDAVDTQQPAAQTRHDTGDELQDQLACQTHEHAGSERDRQQAEKNRGDRPGFEQDRQMRAKPSAPV